MPIEQTIHPLDRLIIGIATGDLTLPDLAAFTQNIIRANLLHYRKLIDTTHCTPVLSEKELAALAQVLRSVQTDRRRGPLAIVADPNRGELAHLFAALGVDGRPAQVFRNIHDARRWLADKPVQDE